MRIGVSVIATTLLQFSLSPHSEILPHIRITKSPWLFFVNSVQNVTLRCLQRKTPGVHYSLVRIGEYRTSQA